jgi:hypothetical protein
MNLRLIGVIILGLSLAACGKVGCSGTVDRAFGSWAAVKLPDKCVAKQIAADEHGGVSVLCEDGRVFH